VKLYAKSKKLSGKSDKTLAVHNTAKWARLPGGAEGKYLKMVSGLPTWSDPLAGDDHNILSETHLDTVPVFACRR